MNFEEESNFIVPARVGDFITIDDKWLAKQKSTLRNHDEMDKRRRPYLVIAKNKNNVLIAVPMSTDLRRAVTELDSERSCTSREPILLFASTHYSNGGVRNNAVYLNRAIAVPALYNKCRLMPDSGKMSLSSLEYVRGRPGMSKTDLMRARYDVEQARSYEGHNPPAIPLPDSCGRLFEIVQAVAHKGGARTNLWLYIKNAEREMTNFYNTLGRDL